MPKELRYLSVSFMDAVNEQYFLLAREYYRAIKNFKHPETAEA